jgi:hypothetical protein
MATLVYSGRNIMATRKAIKEMAKAGGHHEIKVDMPPPRDFEAQELLHMAAGATSRDIENWRSEIISKRDAERKYPHIDRRGKRKAYNYGADADAIEMRGPRCTYKADPFYELEMAGWAEGVMARNS